jgi:uncharacterized membrane protein YgaE (UPF0421/DUF939 family)
MYKNASISWFLSNNIINSFLYCYNIMEEKKTYYEMHKDEINLRRSQIVGCKVCNCAFRYDMKKFHLNSKKHLKKLNLYKEKEYTLNDDLNKIIEYDDNDKYIFIK